MDRTKLDHLPLYDVPFHLHATQDAEYKARVLLQAQASASVLSQVGMTKCDLLPRFNSAPELMVILIGDLTDEGLAFAKKGYQKWLAGCDRSMTQATFERSEKSLTLQVKKFRGDANVKTQ